jgi:unsaturated chondroitin disaccharide hydrolase
MAEFPASRLLSAKPLLISASLLTVASLLTAGIILSPTTANAAPRAATSVSCLPMPHAVTTEQSDALFTLASTKLRAASSVAGTRRPFGALRAQPEYTRTGAKAWTSGFFAAELWLMYARSRSPQWLESARTYTKGLIKVANYGGSHDLGFMVGLPMGLASRLDPSAANQKAYRNASITAARTLAKRWNPNVLALKSSDYNGRWGLIIDSAMNAPLLIETGQLIGGTEGERLIFFGTQHMLTLARTFVRPDGSTYHRLEFNPRTGALVGPIAGQGLNQDISTWARGQAWAINGFARAYELTGNTELLNAARRTANYWVSRVPQGCIPAWDFDIYNSLAPRDSSAAAIAADGMLDLARVAPESETDYRSYADVTLGLLTTPWLNTTHSINPGILLQQSVNVPNDPREGSYVWGDYYLLDALSPEPADPVN